METLVFLSEVNGNARTYLMNLFKVISNIFAFSLLLLVFLNILNKNISEFTSCSELHL